MFTNKGCAGYFVHIYHSCISGPLSFQVCLKSNKYPDEIEDIFHLHLATSACKCLPVCIKFFMNSSVWFTQSLLFVWLQDFLWLLWAFHSGWTPVLLPLRTVGAHLGADWTLASHGRCVFLSWLLCQCVCRRFSIHQNSQEIVLQQVVCREDPKISNIGSY